MNTALFTDRLMDLELEKSALKMFGSSSFGMNKQTVFVVVVKRHYIKEDLCNCGKDVMHQLAQLKEPCVVNEKNCSKMDTHLLMDQLKKQSWRFRGLAENVWTSWTQTPLWHHLRRWNLLGIYFYGTFDKQLDNQIWVTADRKRPFVLQPGFRNQKQLFSKVLFSRVGSNCFPKCCFWTPSIQLGLTF